LTSESDFNRRKILKTAIAVGAAGSINSVSGKESQPQNGPYYRLSVNKLSSTHQNSMFSSEHISEETIRQRMGVIHFLDLTVDEQSLLRRLISKEEDYIYFSERPSAGVSENRIVVLNGDEYRVNLVAYR